MSKKIKILLVILVVGVIAVVAAGAGGYFWLVKNKDSLRAEGLRMDEEAKAFGSSRASEECVTEALRRHSAGAGFMQQVKNKIFLERCLDAAIQPAGYCDDVPRGSEILKSVAYTMRTCEARGLAHDESCARLLDVIEDHCDKWRAKQPQSSPTP